MTGIATVDTWLYSTLSTDVTLVGLISTRVYRDMAPANPTFPCIVFWYMPGGLDVRGIGTINIMVNGNWIVKAIDRDNSAATAVTIADRIYTLLHGQSSGGVLACVRDGPISYTELVDGMLYQHVGGMYQIIVQ